MSSLSLAMILFYFVSAAITIVITVLLYLLDIMLWPLFGIIGVLVSLPFLGTASSMISNMVYLKKKKLWSEMECEQVELITEKFGISDKYIFSYQQHLALPIRYIANIKITKTSYINSLKGHCGLVVTMQGGEKFVLFHYGAIASKKRLQELKVIEATINQKIVR